MPIEREGLLPYQHKFLGTRFERAIVDMAQALDVPRDELQSKLVLSAIEHRYDLTLEGLELWAGAAQRGEVGLNEILIAIESKVGIDEIVATQGSARREAPVDAPKPKSRFAAMARKLRR